MFGDIAFQTKLTYGMICYFYLFGVAGREITFQTKLTYGMICYGLTPPMFRVSQGLFQTKLTYGMICYLKAIVSTFTV